MVKLGFIAEGDTESIILEKSDFFNYLISLNLDFIPEVINVKGNGNLLPKNLTEHTQTLEDKGATHIFILTDLDNDECITNTRARIDPVDNYIVIVSVKATEAWFLSETEAMRTYLKDTTFNHENPELIQDPYEEIKSLRMIRLNRGTVSKTTLANTMVKNCNFSILRATEHPNCNSAKYFIRKIQEVAAMQ